MANLQRIVDKQGRTGKKRCGGDTCRGWHPRHPSEINKSDSDEQKKVVSFFFRKNRGDTLSGTQPIDATENIAPDYRGVD